MITGSDLAVTTGSGLAVITLSGVTVTYPRRDRPSLRGVDLHVAAGERVTVASPLHKQVYDIVTGECFTHPALHLQTYPVQVVDGYVEVALEVATAVAAEAEVRVAA